tara:strand:- start:44008 stop:44190 length:183 start_codon:yes stop_codon:yes gene_type:complete
VTIDASFSAAAEARSLAGSEGGAIQTDENQGQKGKQKGQHRRQKTISSASGVDGFQVAFA